MDEYFGILCDVDFIGCKSQPAGTARSGAVNVGDNLARVPLHRCQHGESHRTLTAVAVDVQLDFGGGVFVEKLGELFRVGHFLAVEVRRGNIVVNVVFFHFYKVFKMFSILSSTEKPAFLSVSKKSISPRFASTRFSEASSHSRML